MKPIEWRENNLFVLDQRKLPCDVDWISVEDADGMAAAIQEMALRGAPLIGIAAAYGLAMEARKHSASQEDLIAILERAGEKLRSARPTAVNLAWAVERVLERARGAFLNKQRIEEAVLEEARKIHEEDRLTCAQIGELGAEILPRGAVLTHCNTGSLATGGDGTAYAMIKEGFRKGKITHVFVPEARPFLQGARLTAFELKEDRIPFTLITDSMAGYFLSRGEIASVAVGADRIATNGDTANKIGTYSLAVLAKENSVPFFVAAPTSSFDPAIPTGDAIPIEERGAREVIEIMGVRIAPPGVHAAHPAFDVTPAAYIKGIITEKGVAFPPFKEVLSRWLD